MQDQYHVSMEDDARTLKGDREGFSAPTAAPADFAEPLPRAADQTVIIGRPPSSFAWLVITSGPRAGVLFRLDPKGSSVGRDSATSDFILDDEAVSSQHAKLRVEKNDEGEEQFFIYDLATTNGTVVNGEQIVKQGLVDGDVIVLGTITMVFKEL